MHRSIAYPYNLVISTIHYSTHFTTIELVTIEHMVMFVVISIVIQINGQVYGSINYHKRGMGAVWGRKVDNKQITAETQTKLSIV